MTAAFVPLSRVLPYWPDAVLGPPPEALQDVGVAEFAVVDESPGKLRFEGSLIWMQRLTVSSPTWGGLTLALLDSGEGFTRADVAVQVAPDFLCELRNVSLALEVATPLLRAVERGADGWTPVGDHAPATIRLQGTNVSVDLLGNLGLSGGTAELDAVEIGETGIVLEVAAIEPLADPGRLGFSGVRISGAHVHLPSGIDVALGGSDVAVDLTIANDGVSGSIAIDLQGRVTAGTLFGVGFRLRGGRLAFRQSAIAGATLDGDILLPFFDRWVGVRLSIGMGAAVTVELTEQATSLEVEGVLALAIRSLALSVADGRLVARMAGTLTPLVDVGGAWPGIEVRELVIDSDGNVRIDGGWLDLPRQVALDFHGFRVELTRLGAGRNRDGEKWIALQGTVRLAAAIPAAVSSEGLRILWRGPGEGRVEWTGLGIEMEIPGVLRVGGRVSFGDAGEPGFSGQVRVDLDALDVHVDGELVVSPGSFGVVLDGSFPTGIPLWATGLGIYGLKGLLALDRRPTRGPEQGWYDWYVAPPKGITSIADKWAPEPGAKAFGAGIVLGTLADNGFAFSGELLLAVSFPGPIILLEGKASILSPRAANPLFRALAVIDGLAGSVLINVDAGFRYGDGGELIDIHAGAEAYFSVRDPLAWHLYLGQDEPRDRRVRAELFQLLHADGYLMLTARSLRTGAWLGWDQHWRFGPLRVEAEAWLEGNVALSWRPAHFHGDLWLHGRLALSVFGVGLGVALDARLAAEVFDPFHLLAALSITLELPWPLPDIGVGVTLEWGPDRKVPDLPAPLQDAAIEHPKVSASWALPRRTEESAGGDPPPSDAPVIPLDARPCLTFARAVEDQALVGDNAQPPAVAWERIGDPARGEGPLAVRYRLKSLVLSKWVPAVDDSGPAGRWTAIAGKGGAEPWPVELHGVWAPDPALPFHAADDPGRPPVPPIDQTKLLLFSRNPFDHAAEGGRAWDDWFTSQFPTYPCVEVPSDELLCYDLGDPTSAPLRSPWRHPREPALLVAWAATTSAFVGQGPHVGLCFLPVKDAAPAIDGQPVAFVAVYLPRPSYDASLTLTAHRAATVIRFDAALGPLPPIRVEEHETRTIDLFDRRIGAVAPLGALVWSEEVCLHRVCLRRVAGEEVERRRELAEHVSSQASRWSEPGSVLEPYAGYRLQITTETEARGSGELASYGEKTEARSEYVYFRTEGPPGLARLSPPTSDLDRLGRYVARTTPADAGPAGARFYRGCDVTVDFNEDYVEALYAGARRNLGVELRDRNDARLLDAAGRGAFGTATWEPGDANSPRSESDERWLAQAARGDCLDIAGPPPADCLRDGAGRPALAAGVRYQARLVPLLLGESFAGIEAPGDVAVFDAYGWGQDGGGLWSVPSDPMVDGMPEKVVTQWATVGDADPRSSDLGTSLVWLAPPPLRAGAAASPSTWSAYRVSAYAALHVSDEDPGPGAAGVVFCRRDRDNYYAFALSARGRWLIKVVRGTPSVLAEDDVPAALERPYLIAVDVGGGRIRAYVDGAPLFDVTDGTHTTGTIGLHARGRTLAIFGDVRVEDQHPEAPVVHSFAFTTSRFASFFHHAHSHDGDAPRIDLTGGTDEQLGSWFAAGAALATLPLDPPEAESWAYDRFAELVLGAAARRPVPAVRAVRVVRAGAPLALLFLSPEPIDWRRVDLALARAAARSTPPAPPGAVKITDFIPASATTGASVRLLLRETTSLGGCQLEYRARSAWRFWHRFGADEPRSDGTRIWIDGSTAIAPDAVDPGALRFRAAATGPSSTPGTIDLRVVALDGAIQHSRAFLSPGAFAAMTNARALRKRDGTGFVLYLPADGPGAKLEAGDHRLTITYRRDNRNRHPGSPVFTEGGSAAAERVVLDLPWGGSAAAERVIRELSLPTAPGSLLPPR